MTRWPQQIIYLSISSFTEFTAKTRCLGKRKQSHQRTNVAAACATKTNIPKPWTIRKRWNLFSIALFAAAECQHPRGAECWKQLINGGLAMKSSEYSKVNKKTLSARYKMSTSNSRQLTFGDMTSNGGGGDWGSVSVSATILAESSTCNWVFPTDVEIFFSSTSVVFFSGDERTGRELISVVGLSISHRYHEVEVFYLLFMGWLNLLSNGKIRWDNLILFM